MSLVQVDAPEIVRRWLRGVVDGAPVRAWIASPFGRVIATIASGRPLRSSPICTAVGRGTAAATFFAASSSCGAITVCIAFSRPLESSLRDALLAISPPLGSR